MRYYVPGDEIYMFGFSRGAYTARFLAEMLDQVGLLSAGNEEMCRFAWKTFQKWQVRQERDEKEAKQKRQLLDFMCAFRETFSRPVRPIRFLGLFDTVNSVPVFENAWMRRSKFPYTAKTTARVIRHAVAIDERRAKFRQDLISEVGASERHSYHLWHRSDPGRAKADRDDEHPSRGRSPGKSARGNAERRDLQVEASPFRSQSETSGIRALSPNAAASEEVENERRSVSSESDVSQPSIKHYDEEHDHAHDPDSDVDPTQDIQEVWFAGCHAVSSKKKLC